MSNYVKATNFTAKDSLPTGNAGKIVKGAEIDTELTAVASAISSKADLNSPSLTGTPTAPTAAYGTNTTQLATTAFVQAAIPSGVILLWSGSVATIPGGWALCNGSSGTPDLRNRFVVGAGSTYSVGDTGGANTVTLDSTMIPSHTHVITATGSSGNTSTEHTHSLSASGTTGNQSADHTHTGTTGTESVGHTHTFSGTSDNMSANATHTHTVSDSGHSHTLAVYNLTSNGFISGGGNAIAVGNSTTTSTATTGITIDSTSVQHTHTYSGTTSGTSASHTHTVTTGGVSANHNHTVTVTGTSGNMSANATHNHTITVTATAANTGGGLAHENRPPYYALAYIMRL